MITLVFTYFKSLALANLRASLYSVRQQDLSRVKEVVVLDNDTADSVREIEAAVDELTFPIPVTVISVKHNDATKTHSWSTNTVVREARTEWVLFCRADYLLNFNLVKRFAEIVDTRSEDWNGFVTGNVYHLNSDIGVCEQTDWRRLGPHALRGLPGAEADYTKIDAGVWMLRRSAFIELDESLTVWGHAQTLFQYQLHEKGVEFVRIPEVLFYHPQHSAPRDLNLAHQQLRERGVALDKLWARHDGAQVY